MDSYKRNRLLGLVGIGIIVLVLAGYYLWAMTADNTRYVEPTETVEEFNALLTGPFDYSIFSLPVGYSKFKSALDDVSLFESFDSGYVLSRLPKRIENIVFSQNGEKAVVFEDDAVSFYDVNSNSLEEILGLTGGWGSGVFDDLTFYSIGYDEPTKQDALKAVGLADGSVEDLVYFIRDIENYELMMGEDTFAMVDQTSQPNILYLIDQDSRTNIYEAEYLKLADISEDFIAFKAGENQFQSDFIIYDIQTEQSHILPYRVDEDNFVFDDGYAYFVSDSEDLEASLSIENLINSNDEPQIINLYRMDVLAKTYDSVALEELPELPERIEFKDGVLRMKTAENYWDAKII